ncbi:MAG: flavodoxin-dependent (E)-4-hydroxy-3-methylbut-2-enyl-diphosphate synthase [Ruminococcus callidus]|nr:flavodoxin-dependent (E)-4-hydroxy-3-methylbut-2-enyl-diphosphate synthase [Ruminococcus callidus]
MSHEFFIDNRKEQIRMQTKKAIRVGDCVLDGNHIYIQSMLNTRSDDIAGSVAQAVALEQAGCEILRAAIPDKEALKLIPAIKEAVSIPLVADIHFDYRLALEAVVAGIDKIRINPGNIGGMDRVKQVVKACQSRNIPIRIGVNSGSLEKDLLAKYGAPTASALVESAMRHVKMLEDCDFTDIVISMKSSTVSTMIDAYRLAAQQCDYPLHLGVTEAGTAHMGLLKSAIGIGSLLHDGIGATIRVSLTDDPVQEIYAAKDILKCLGLRGGPELVACPTCGRTRIDLVKTAKEVEAALANVEKDIKVAVMGCVVNGPGEAREADIGIAGGDGCAVLFKKGQILRKIPESEIVSELMKEIEKF